MLHLLAADGDIAGLTAVLDSGPVNINLQSDASPFLTPLESAAVAGHAPVVFFLANRGATTRARTWKAAVRGGSVEILDWLATRGTPTFNDRPGLHTAVFFGRLDAAQWLVAHGVPFVDDNIHSSALAAACCGGSLDCVRFCVEQGVPVNALSTTGMSPLAYAIRGGFLDVVQFLLGVGADPDLVADNARETPLVLAASCGNVAVLELMLTVADVGDLRQSRGPGLTPLVAAAREGNTEAVRLLLERQPAAAVLPGHAVTMAAGREGHFDVLRLLLDAGLEPHPSLLTLTIIRGDEALLMYLLLEVPSAVLDAREALSYVGMGMETPACMVVLGMLCALQGRDIKGALAAGDPYWDLLHLPAACPTKVSAWVRGAAFDGVAAFDGLRGAPIAEFEAALRCLRTACSRARLGCLQVLVCAWDTHAGATTSGDGLMRTLSARRVCRPRPGSAQIIEPFGMAVVAFL